MRNGIEKISKREFYALGGFANSALFRKADSRGEWRHYMDHTHPNASDGPNPYIPENAP